MIVKDLVNTITLDEIKMVNEGKTTFMKLRDELEERKAKEIGLNKGNYDYFFLKREQEKKILLEKTQEGIKKNMKEGKVK